jgi:hypothetical protein
MIDESLNGTIRANRPKRLAQAHMSNYRYNFLTENDFFGGSVCFFFLFLNC